MGAKKKKVPVLWEIPDDLWALIKPIFPQKEFKQSGGRPWTDPRRVLDGVIYILRTGCQWKKVPEKYCPGSTCHRRFQQWVQKGVFDRIWQKILQEYDLQIGLKWKWQSGDSSSVKAPLGGKKQAKTQLIGQK